ncbi:MAG TPA: N-acetylmuramoyl-L-alanine amidase, partial [Candidatus Sumerlaeota bacterium]|nr:N-acetylmuramoyl-L-alanine amidase [Candidatus Sumerlaeota bacterium]
WTDIKNVFGDTVIVDNADAGFAASANWTTASSMPNYFFNNYRTRATGLISDVAQWTVALPSAGTYQVYAWWPAASNYATSAPYIITHTAGSTTVNVNQRTNGGKWNLLGTWTFNSGTAVRVKLSCWTSTGSYVAADAIKMVKQ